MNYSKIHVLLLEGYTRQTLPMAKGFRDLGCKVTTLNASKLDVGYVSRYPNEKILGCCSLEDYEGTVDCIKALLMSGKYDLVVPTFDLSACILSEYKNEFSKYAKVESNDWEIYNTAQDKLKTMIVCRDNNIPCPFTLPPIESSSDIRRSEIKFPIVIKPRIGYGAIGFHKIESLMELEQYLFRSGVHLVDCVIQEYIPQTDVQLEAAMFVDNNNEVKSSVIFTKNRWFPIGGGSSTFNITVDRPDIVEICAKLLKKIKWLGCADIDLIQDPRDGTPKVMEINPRVSGSVKICFESGVNIAQQIIEKHFLDGVTAFHKYIIGQRLRCSQTDLLWFIKSPNRFRTSPSWFSFKKTKDHTFSITDPLPWFSYTFQGISKYKKEMGKRCE